MATALPARAGTTDTAATAVAAAAGTAHAAAASVTAAAGTADVATPDAAAASGNELPGPAMATKLTVGPCEASYMTPALIIPRISKCSLVIKEL